MKADDLRYEVKQERQDLAETAAELRDVARERVEAAKQAINPLEYARAYPLLAVGAALGAGLAFAMSGSDRKVVSAAVDGAKDAGSVIGDGASAVKQKIAGVVHHGDERQAAADMPANDAPAGLRSRLRSDIDQLLADGLKDLMSVLGSGASSGRNGASL